MTRVFVSLFTVLLLAGCGTMADPTSWFDDNVKEVIPNELTDFEKTLQVKTLWDTDIGSGTDNLRLRLIPRVDGGRVYAADSEGQVKAFDSLTGKRIWGVDLDLPLSGGPGSGEGLVLLGTSDGEVVALSAENGEQLWKAQVSSEVLSVPAAASGVVVVHSIDGKLVGLSAVDGKPLWLYSRKVPVLTLRGTSSPVINGGVVYTGFAGGKLVALDLQNGFVQWEVSITAPSGRSELER
ncbi:MAG: PQQ-binding-like beta-propeller repeat protein, partial [Gammaproteobacteria bacterium]|nr:PQQ-binding-like beta-propeller repeat protein [Gammaproteobacteria bacterium]